MRLGILVTHNSCPLNFLGNSTLNLPSFVLLFSRVQLNRRFGASASLDLLDKLLDSLRALIRSRSDDKKEAFLVRLRTTISENIKLQTPIPDSEHREHSLQE